MQNFLHIGRSLLLTVLLLVPSGVLHAQENLLSIKESENLISTSSSDPLISIHKVSIVSSDLNSAFNFNLPGGSFFIATTSKKSENKNTSGSLSTTYSGSLTSENGTSEGTFTLTTTETGDNQKNYNGVFHTPDGQIFILKGDSKDPDLSLLKVDGNKQIECSSPAVSDINFKNFNKKEYIRPDLTSQASVIRIAVAYTPDAVTTAGSISAVESLIANMISTANTAHANSQTGISFTLTSTNALSTNSADNFIEDLEEATNLTDGQWDELGTIKSRDCADMISVVVGGTQNFTTCGIAWLGGDADDIHLYESQMFSIVSANQVGCNTLTFPHELAHNMGSDHDYPNSSQQAAYPYSYGYRFTGNSTTQFRTVMAYSPGTRIPYFSNPRLTYDGAALGVTNQTDNSASIALTAPVIAGFMPDGSNCASATPVPTAIPTNSPTPPSTLTDSISLTGKVKRVKNISQLTLSTVATLGSSPVQHLPVTLFFDSRANGLFSKRIKSGSTGQKANFSYKRETSKVKVGYYKSCYLGASGEQILCSNTVRIKQVGKSSARSVKKMKK